MIRFARVKGDDCFPVNVGLTVCFHDGVKAISLLLSMPVGFTRRPFKEDYGRVTVQSVPWLYARASIGQHGCYTRTCAYVHAAPPSRRRAEDTVRA